MTNARIRNPLNISKDNLEQAIQNCLLGKTDRLIATMYYLNQYPQIDIAEEVCLERSTVSKRLKIIRENLSHIFT